MDVVKALGATEGVVCFVGAGGKKTTMYALASRIERAVVTATVRIPIFDDAVERVVVTDDPRAVIDRTTAWPLGVVPAQERADRYLGYEPDTVAGLAGSEADVILVKADGARMRRFKAPGEHEPQLPATATTVVPIVSAHVVGRPLDDERVHRVERVAAISGLEPGEEITPTAVGRVIASEAGGRKGVPDEATVIPLVNMVDDDRLEAVGREIATEIHARTAVPRVVLARMTDPDPIVRVIE